MERNPVNNGGRLSARLLGGLALIAAAHLGASGAAAAAGVFAGFSGGWSGDGTVHFNNGATERIRCRSRGSTSNSDNALQLTLQCASASYQFEVDGRISSSGGRLSGTWTEKQYDVTGSVSGTATGGRFRAVVSAPSLGASVNMDLSGSGLAVTIRPMEARVSEVSMQLQRN
ncbi:MAG TPA: hypothetical protein VHG92_12890 [Afifellaceae bacterium]|nr:hypothetical protein [Afifellaceae bacterium]